ncbi:cytochrome c oxidase subunit IV-domain-containing protein [Mrakia frigida]|uniref:cytochrome c oxidase subunit IV-domain-containing protein n=1 Tax=Mrakia frigida TaxID=29902 RepID=UPI003FCC1D32
MLRSTLKMRSSISPLLSLRAMSAAAAPSPSSTEVAAASKATQLSSIRTTDNTVNVLKSVHRTYELMPLQEKIVINDILQEVQKADWKTMTLDEKKAAYFIAFGPYGARRPRQTTETSRRILYSMACCFFTVGIVWNVLRYFRAPPAITSTHEYQAMENEWMRERNINPITGVSSEEGKKGDGMINSGMFPKWFP